MLRAYQSHHGQEIERHQTSRKTCRRSFSLGPQLCLFVPSNDCRPQETQPVRKELRKNKNIVILKPDKGNGVVVLDRTDYDLGILKIINDTSKFRPIKDDPTLLREGRLQRLLRKLKKDDHLDNVVYENIYPKGSQPARIYGLPKMHKDCMFQ